MKRKLGLALSGGGIKAYCQIGVYRAFEEQGLQVDGFAGTSMGSIIAAFMATGISASELQERLLNLEATIKKEKLFTANPVDLVPLVTKKADGFIPSTGFDKALKVHLDALGLRHLSDLKTPFVCVAVDLVSGRPVYFTNDPASFAHEKHAIIVSDVELGFALRASCSFPLVFHSAKLNSMHLVDGGVLMNVPVEPLRSMGFDKIISVTMQDLADYDPEAGLKEVALRIIDLMVNDSELAMIAQSDLNINVKSGKTSIFSFGKGSLMIERGYKAAQKQFDQVSKLALTKKRFWL
jgi:NTE family protein